MKKASKKKVVRNVDTRAIVRRMLSLIRTPEKWVKGVYAANDLGMSVREDFATKFCLHGAFYKACNDLGPSTEIKHRARKRINDLIGYRFDRSMVRYNDHKHRKHYQIVKLLQNALKAQKP